MCARVCEGGQLVWQGYWSAAPYLRGMARTLHGTLDWMTNLSYDCFWQAPEPAPAPAPES